MTVVRIRPREVTLDAMQFNLDEEYRLTYEEVR